MIRYLPFLLVILLSVFGQTVKGENKTSEIPIKFIYRESLLHKGTFVAQFRSDSNSTLSLKVQFDRSGGGERKTFLLLIKPLGKKEVGSLQGWKVESGDIITVQCDGYPNATYNVP